MVDRRSHLWLKQSSLGFKGLPLREGEGDMCGLGGEGKAKMAKIVGKERKGKRLGEAMERQLCGDGTEERRIQRDM